LLRNRSFGRPARSALLAVALLHGCSSGDRLNEPDLDAALASIDATAIEQPMRVLADDALEGRATGSRGYLVAADYVAGELESFGLQPAGDDTTFYQQVPLLSARLVADESAITLIHDDRRATLEIFGDYVLDGDFLRTRADITAPVVLAGFGVTAPEHDWDDYAGLDVRGKIAVVFRGAPASLPHDERAYHASGRVKCENAISRGAVGLLTALLPGERERRPWPRTVSQSKLPAMRWLDEAGAPRDAFPELFVIGALSKAGEHRLFKHAPESFAEVAAAIEAGQKRGFDLPIELEVRTSSRHAKLESPNVVALLLGSDPQLREEYVVLTAHLDHLGIGDAVDGDAIYNGAYDNASGVASLLAVARAFAALPRAPRRSLVFLAVTGEEKGLLGSDYFAANPTVPSAAIVANVNLDMALMLHPLNDVIAFGSEHSTLAEAVQRATARLDLAVSEDPIPEEVFFIRSDQYSFVRHGIPALFVASGRRSGDSALDGHELWQEWMRTVWHTPGDDMSQSIDFEAGAEFARLNFLVVYHVANADESPAWVPGDFFGERFGSLRRR